MHVEFVGDVHGSNLFLYASRFPFLRLKSAVLQLRGQCPGRVTSKANVLPRAERPAAGRGKTGATFGEKEYKEKEIVSITGLAPHAAYPAAEN